MYGTSNAAATCLAMVVLPQQHRTNIVYLRIAP